MFCNFQYGISVVATLAIFTYNQTFLRIINRINVVATFDFAIMTFDFGKTNQSSTYLPKTSQNPPSPENMKSLLARNCGQPVNWENFCTFPVNWEKYKYHILQNSDDLDMNITNKIDLEKKIDKITQKKFQAAYKESIYVNKHIATNHQIKKLKREKHKLERKGNKLTTNNERNTTQNQTICNKINILTKEIKRISKKNTTRQQMKLIEKLN